MSDTCRPIQVESPGIDQIRAILVQRYMAVYHRFPDHPVLAAVIRLIEWINRLHEMLGHRVKSAEREPYATRKWLQSSCPSGADVVGYDRDPGDPMRMDVGVVVALYDELVIHFQCILHDCLRLLGQSTIGVAAPQGQDVPVQPGFYGKLRIPDHEPGLEEV